MSRESSLHVALVRKVASEIRSRHADLYSLTVYLDLPEAEVNRPQMIGGYIPDVFAVDAPETRRIIGEAKTPLDCETERSRRQIEGFLSHLSYRENAYSYLCVPAFYEQRARRLIEAAQLASGAGRVVVDVVGG